MKKVILVIICLMFFGCWGETKTSSSRTNKDVQRPTSTDKLGMGVAPIAPRATSAAVTSRVDLPVGRDEVRVLHRETIRWDRKSN